MSSYLEEENVERLDLDALIRESAPRVSVGPHAGDAMAQVAHAAALGQRPRVRFARRRRTVAFTAVALLGVTGTGVAVADSLSAHSGWFGTPSSEEDASEFLNTGASDFPAVAARLAPSDLPLPAGVTVQDATAVIVDQARANPGLMQTTGVKAGYFIYAECQWERVWLSGASDARTASAAIDRLRNDPVSRAVDDVSVRKHQDEVLRLGRQGDLTALRADFTANCGGELGLAPRTAR